ncbi:hypothetical protein Tco_0045302 [Tanacetum coccineum]
MDLYHSRLTPYDLNDLIIKYKIPRDLHPWLPSEDFVVFELPGDAIGIYHRMFDFSGVQIPFSSFLLALIKHYRVHFSQQGPSGLNKAITFKVLCQSLQIQSTVTLFRVFQTLCKQGDWFSFAKRRASSPVCIDDNRSCMKHWKSGFFFIDRRVIQDAMVWRHPDTAIDDPRPVAGSFTMADVRRLSAHVIKLREMPEGVLVLSGLSRVWKSRICDPVLRGADGNVMGIYDFLCLPEWIGAEVQEEPHFDVRSTLQRLPFYCTPPAAADVVIPDPTLEDLTIGTPSSKILAKVEASQKRKASISGATSGHVAKRTSDGDDDACVEILLVNPLRSAAVTILQGTRVGALLLLLLKVLKPEGIMVNDAATPSGGASRPRPSSEPAPPFKEVSGDAIHTNFFPFSAGPYYATYPEGDVPYRPTFEVLNKEVFKDPVVCKTMVDQFPTPSEMVRVESLFDDQLTAKMSVLHCMMMPHGGELLARYHGLNQSHHEYVLSADFMLKGY